MEKSQKLKMKNNHCSKISSLEEEVFYKFKNSALLKRALNHPSILKNKTKPNSKNDSEIQDYPDSFGSYEKLEFLGDKVLNLVVAESIFRLFPNNDEGDLSIKLNYFVSGKIISQIAEEINLIKYINTALGVQKMILNNSKNILEDCMEAIIGAIYLDGGFLHAQKSVTSLWRNKIFQNINLIKKDFKTKLQEILQKNGYNLPKYNVFKNEGTAHQPIFYIELDLGEKKFPKFYGDGGSLKIAQSVAAQKAVEFLEQQNDKFI